MMMFLLIISLLSFMKFYNKIMPTLLSLELLMLVVFYYLLSSFVSLVFLIMSFIVISSLLGFMILLNMMMIYSRDLGTSVFWLLMSK